MSTQTIRGKGSSLGVVGVGFDTRIVGLMQHWSGLDHIIIIIYYEFELRRVNIKCM